MDKGIIEAMVTKLSEKFVMIMLKKRKIFCRCGLTHLDTAPSFKESLKYFWVTLYGTILPIKSLVNARNPEYEGA